MRENLDMVKTYSFYLFLFVLIIISNGICIEYVNGTLAIIIGCLWMFASVLLYLLYLRKSGNVFAIMVYAIITAIISGMTSSAYYSIKNVAPYKAEVVIILFSALLAGNLIMSLFIRKRLLISVINLTLAIFILLASLYLWVLRDKSLGSSMSFMSIVYLCFAIAQLIVEKKEIRRINMISISSLLMFGGILIAVLVAVSEGDLLDLLEIIPDVHDGSIKKKRGNQIMG